MVTFPSPATINYSTLSSCNSTTSLGEINCSENCMQNLFSAYQYQRLSLSLDWKWHVRLRLPKIKLQAGTGFSTDIGMRSRSFSFT
jgi:hypothetical protein